MIDPTLILSGAVAVTGAGIWFKAWQDRGRQERPAERVSAPLVTGSPVKHEPPVVTAVSPAVPLAGTKRRNPKVVERRSRIVSYLQQHGRPIHYQTVANSLGAQADIVNHDLHRLVERGLITKVKTGVFVAKGVEQQQTDNFRFTKGA